MTINPPQLPTVRLVDATVPTLDAAIAGDDALAGALGLPVVPGWATFAEALPVVRGALADDPTGIVWGPRLFVAGAPPAVVGWGGFKGAPRDGVVEIGYEIAESRRCRGLATAAATAMLDVAFACPDVTAVIAHTLGEPNPSNRVLSKLGFQGDGEFVDGDQLIWRFRLDRPSTR